MMYSVYEIYQTLIRYQPYLVGLGLGYLLHCLRETPRLSINTIALTWIWVLAALIGCLVVYGLVPYQKDPTLVASTAERALYGGLHRLAWAVALSWVILASVKVRCHRPYDHLSSEKLCRVVVDR